ncbi:MAG: 30S ribosomal protein S2 [Clostridia bacterium]|nr:30S ribosomal protein S2 [Clostridia bacterium]
MSIIPMKTLLENGVHFGHQTKRWDPRMAPYIYVARNGIYILDLQKTVTKLQEAYNVTKQVVAAGGKVLFVGTKKQIQEVIRDEATRAGMYYINSRWLGGTLTNLATIKKRIARLVELENMEQNGTFDLLPKKEVIGLKKEMEKLTINLGGIKEMEKLPDLIVLVDSKKEYICAKEARKLGVPTIGIIDSNCNPEDVDYVIPGNDDSVKSVSLIVSKLADAVLEVKEGNTSLSEEVETETMAELVAEVGVDKIERKPRVPKNNMRNNYSYRRDGKFEKNDKNEETVETNETKTEQ